MINLTTQFAGLNLRNPLIVGSSGLSNSIEKIKEFENQGAAAIIFKSIFEEEITNQFDNILKEAEEHGFSDERLDYFDYRIKEENLERYLKNIAQAKEQLFIPIIASINCNTANEWMYYAKKFELAGADAIELNMFMLPSDASANALQIEKMYFEVVEKILKEIKIPVILKISPYFADLARIIINLSKSGIAALTLFNRFFSPDIDIEKLELINSDVLSKSSDSLLSMRWIAMMSRKVKCDLSASTGVHDGKTFIKQLLAGAKTVQIVSTLYKNGATKIPDILDELERWMKRKGFDSIKDFNGKLAQENLANPSVYERMQFMRYFGGYNSPI